MPFLSSSAISFLNIIRGGGAAGEAVPLLLDLYPNAAAAYSLRKLRVGYTGDAIRVRIDTTGQPEYNIGFVNNELDVATLEGYCTGGLDAFVITWYDQSGNGYNATQATVSNQPQIVSGGSVILENGKPSIEFDGSDAFIVWNNTTAPTLFQDMSDAITLLSVERATVISNINTAWFNGSTLAEIRVNNTTSKVPFSVGYSNNTSGFGVTDDYINNAEMEFSSTLSVAQRLTSRYINGDDLDVYINNASAISTTFTIATGNRSVSTNNSTFSIGARSRDGGQLDVSFFTGTMQEIVLYKSNLLSDNSEINININDYYDIYPETYNFEQALLTDGVDDFVSFPSGLSALNNATQASLHCWINVDSGNSAAFGTNQNFNNRFGFIPFPDNNLYFSASNGSNAFGSVNYSSFYSTWMLVSMVYDGSLIGNSNRLKAYINGVQQTLTFNGETPGTLNAAAGNFFQINRSAVANVTGQAGYDEGVVTTDVSTPSQILDYYNSGNGALATDCFTNILAYWRMNEADGATSLADSVGSATGTMNNFNTPPAYFVAHNSI